MSNVTDVTEQIDEKTYCYLHPAVETGLRCNKCGNYICSRCAVRTPVGYRCPACVRQQQDTFFTAIPTDYVIAAVVAFALSVPIVYVLTRLGLFFAILIGIPAGGLISEAVHRALRRRRGRYTYLIVAAAVVIGALAASYQIIGLILQTGETSALSALLVPGIVAVLCAATAAARFRFGK